MTAEHSTLAAALVAALADLVTVTKGRTAQAGSYSYNYADLGDLVSDTRPVLAEHGLVALTPVHAHEGRLACTVELVHVSGESKTFGPLPFPEGRDAQATGSWMTYFRRYALLAALGMAASDDDGAGATAGSRVAPVSREPEPIRFDPADPMGWPETLPVAQAKQAALYRLGGDDDAAKAWWANADPPVPTPTAWLLDALPLDDAEAPA